MAKITDHDNAYAARVTTEPSQRTANRVAGRGPIAPLREGNPQWYDDDTTLLVRTINRTGTPEKRRAGR
jgi:hypothetical protein